MKTSTDALTSETSDTPYAPVHREYRLMTDGNDAELDAIGVCVAALKELTDIQQAAVVSYLKQRFGCLT